jgi:acetoin:2,6-dichlorophenolindophenol oxidoreductase subunit beta
VRELTYLAAIREAQVEEMTSDETVILMGQDIRANLYGTGSFLDMFGAERIRDLPTSETACVGAAVGAAMTGLRPVVDMGSASFSFVALDQFISEVSKIHYMSAGQLKVPVTYRIPLMYNGGVGVQHSDRPYPMFMQMPGLKLICPTTPSDAKAMMQAAIRDDDPVIVFEDTYNWSSRGPVADPPAPAPIGTAAIAREGDDVTVVGIGRTVAFALTAAAELADSGVSVEVIDLRSLAPIDWGAIFGSVGKTGRLVVADAAVSTCSAASEVAATVAEHRFEALLAPIRRVTSPPVHSPYTPGLERTIYPDAGKIAAAVRSVAKQASHGD